MRVGIIGTGSMGAAIAQGAREAGIVSDGDLILANRTPAKARALADRVGALVAADGAELLATLTRGEGPLVIVLAVKPHQVVDVVSTLPARLLDGVTVVSVAAGLSLDVLDEALPAGAAAVRAMPNVAARVHQSMTALCFAEGVTDAQKNAVTRLFGALGRTECVADSLFAPFSALAGCAPAWIAALTDAFATAGVAHGLTKTQATAAFTQALRGSADLLDETLSSGGNAQSLVESVCSPGGTTVAGLLALTDAGLHRVARAGVDAAVSRDKTM